MFRTTLLSIFLLFNSVNSLHFSNFIKMYDKQYTDDELISKFNIYQDNVQKINQHNNEGLSWSMAVNQFADLTEGEFKTKTLCNYNQRLNNQQNSLRYTRDMDDLPSSIDWTTKGAVTPVKDQGQCGSCWAFSTTGSVEGAYFLTSGNLTSLSEQQLVDCSGSYQNQGCNGGLMDYGFEYIKDNGICSEKDYTYKAVDGTCKKCTSVTKINSFVDVTPNSESSLQKAVASQPVSVAIEADTSVFQFYKSGVIDSASCGTSLDHGVLVVGYGTLNGKDYWKVKNSWGSSWGDDGYVLIGRNVKSQPAQGICGILSEPSYPTLTKID